MSALYPEIDPHDHGLLDVGDGHRIYWEVCGNPRGKPVIVIHGGPGSGCSAGMRRFFDPAAYRIVLFDQRNCGRSLPHASDPAVDLATNTTPHLIADIERLREHLSIDRWMLFGGSWGSTLALAYAETHPDRVTEIVIPGVTTTRPSEIDWLYRGMAPLFPAEYARFVMSVPEGERGSAADLVAAYYRLLHDADSAVRLKAAQDFSDWELASLSVDPDAKPGPRWSDPAFILARARIVTHYFYHQAWLEEGILLREAYKLRGIPGILIHGRLDLGAPLMTAWELAQVWPESELVIVGGAGHSTSDAGMPEAIITATDRLAYSSG